MPTRNVARMFAVLSAATVTACALPVRAQAPALRPGDEGSIRRYIEHWAGQLRQAEDGPALLQAKTKLVEGFGADTGAAHQFTYAQQAARLVAPILDLDDTGRQINAAAALASMPQASIQAALEKMIAHKNPAVRFLGWKGYREARTAILTQGGRMAETLFASLRARAAAERSPAALRAMYRMMILTPLKPDPVSAAMYRRAQDRSYAALRGSWGKTCQRLIDGEDVLVDAADAGVTALQNFAAAFFSDKTRLKEILQMIVDAAYCCAHTYEARMMEHLKAETQKKALQAKIEAAVAGEAGTSGRREPAVPGPERAPGSPAAGGTAPPPVDVVELQARIVKLNEVLEASNEAASVLAMVLLDCEKALNGITRQKNDLLGTPLSDPRIAGTREGGAKPTVFARWLGKDYGVLAWVEVLKSYGVVRPKFQETAPTTSPAT